MTMELDINQVEVAMYMLALLVLWAWIDGINNK